MSKTMSIRTDHDNYEFLHEITKEERSDLSKAVQDLVTRGRILLAVELQERRRPPSAGLRSLPGFNSKYKPVQFGI
jgi:hypothetical protein